MPSNLRAPLRENRHTSRCLELKRSNQPSPSGLERGCIEASKAAPQPAETSKGQATLLDGNSARCLELKRPNQPSPSSLKAASKQRSCPQSRKQEARDKQLCLTATPLLGAGAPAPAFAKRLEGCIEARDEAACPHRRKLEARDKQVCLVNL